MTFQFKKQAIALFALPLAMFFAMPANADIGYFNDADETEAEEVIKLEQEEKLEKEQQEEQQEQKAETQEVQESQELQQEKKDQPVQQLNKTLIEEKKSPQKQEEIKLNVEKTNLQDVIAPQEQEELPLKKKQNPLNLLKSTGYKFENGFIKSQRFTFYTHGGFTMAAQKGSKFADHTEYAANEFQSSTIFANGKTRLDWGYNFSRPTDYNSNFFAKISFAELWHKINDNQMVMIGNTRVQNGIEGGMSSSLIKFVSRSQISRNFANAISNSVRNKGTYKYLDYDIAFSDGSRYWQQVLGGAEVTAIFSAKPLANHKHKYGSLKVGGSIDHGRSHAQGFTVVGGHALYDYKKFSLDFEYQYANGSAGSWYKSDKAHGLYTTASYFIDPKFQLLARYDYFQNFDTNLVSNEYGVGLNYYITPRAKLMLNYILCDNNVNSSPAHKIYLGADITTYSIFDKLLERL